MKDFSLPLAISVDGPDGAGKSTIVSHIAANYPTILPLPAIGLGLMPYTQEERLHWYKHEDPVVVARTILASQKKRFSFIYEYAQNLHFKQNTQGIQHPPLIIWDRGPTSAKAYSYACLRLNTDLPCDIINQLINCYFDVQDLENQIFYIDLYTTVSDTEKYFARATNIIDNHIDRLLVEGQIEYYQKFFRQTMIEKTLKLNPFAPIHTNLKKVEDFINTILKTHYNKNYSYTNPRIYFSSLLQILLESKCQGKITIYGQIVTQGYSNSVVKVKYEHPNDLKILKLIQNIEPIDNTYQVVDSPYFIIAP